MSAGFGASGSSKNDKLTGSLCGRLAMRIISKSYSESECVCECEYECERDEKVSELCVCTRSYLFRMNVPHSMNKTFSICG